MVDCESTLKGLSEVSEYLLAKTDIAGVGKGKEVFGFWYRSVEDALALLKEQDKQIDDLKAELAKTEDNFSEYAEMMQEKREPVALELIREQVPRLLTVEELFALPFGSVVWEENRFLEDDGGTSSTAAAVPLPLSGEGQGAETLSPLKGEMPPQRQRGFPEEDDSEDPDALQPLMRDDRGKGKGLAALVNIDGAPVYLHQRMLQRDHFDSSFQVRYWSAKPTPEQRRAAPWP